MIINKQVATYYNERINKKSKLFKEFNDKPTVSIHDIIKINEQQSYDEKRFFMARGNDLNLLRSVRKREGSIECYMFKFKLDDGHKRRYYNFIKWWKKLQETKA